MSRRRALVAVAAVVLALAAGVGVWRAAAAPEPQTLEARTQAIASTLRCPTCQNLSVADSDSQMARGMRETIAEQLSRGRSREEVRGYFVDRYGEWVLLYPQRDGFGWVAWLAPVVGVGVAGAAAAVFAARRRVRTASPSADLEPAERERVEDAARALAEGALTVPDGVAGERLESALVMLATVRADEEASDAAEDRAQRRVLAALDEADRAGAPAAGQDASPAAEGAGPTGQDAPPAAEGAPREPAAAEAGRAWWRRRPVAWGLVGGLFATALVVALGPAVDPRGEGETPTGGIPGQESETAPTGAGDRADEEELAALREAVEADPEDTRARLMLAARLLERGRTSEAEAQAGEVLAAEPDHPDGLLLVGLARAGQRDPAAETALRRFLDVAPEHHPGVDIARSVLDASAAPAPEPSGDAP